MERANPFDKIYKTINSGIGQVSSPEMPILIDIEITNSCNFKCLFCHTGTKAHKRNTGFMSEYLYNRIIDEIEPYKTPLRFIRWGEPTLHKKFLEFLKIAKTKGILCHFNTNGSLLDENMINALLDLKIDSIKYSFQGTDAKTYSEMRYGEDYNKLVQTAKLFYEMRSNLPYPYIHAATTITYETPEMVQAFKEELQNYCDLVTVGHTKLEHISPEGTKLDKDAKERLSELKQKETIKKVYRPCIEIYNKLSINWDGTVSACCGDYDNYMIVGDLNESSLKDIWQNSKELKRYRDILSQSRHSELPLCSVCFETMELQRSNEK